MANITLEKSRLSKFRRSLDGKRILVIEGNRSTENLLYKKAAPDETRGIISIADGFRQLGLDFWIVQSDSPVLAAYLTIADLILIYAHGEYGEDGRLQGWLDYIGKPYQGPGVMASAVCLDKLMFKRLLSGTGISTPPYRELTADGDRAIAAAELLGFPLMAKLRTGGSSIGITLLRDLPELRTWLKQVGPDAREAYFFEKFIVGRFLTVGIIRMSEGDEQLPILEVLTGESYYDEATKLGGCNDSPPVDFVVPAPLAQDTAAQINLLCGKAFRLAGCEGLARVDLMLDQNNVPHVLEINTIPGLSAASNLTAAFMSLGFTYHDLLLAVLRTAAQRVGGQHALAAA
jgi:D-alanine-D-alanine ligase